MRRIYMRTVLFCLIFGGTILFYAESLPLFAQELQAAETLERSLTSSAAQKSPASSVHSSPRGGALIPVHQQEANANRDSILFKITKSGIRGTFHQYCREVKLWFGKSRGLLLKFFCEAFGIVVITWFFYALIHRFSSKKLKSGKVPLHYLLLTASLEPVVLILGCAGLFFSLLPLVQSLPAHLIPMNIRLFYTLITLLFSWLALRFITVIGAALVKVAEREDNNLNELLVNLL